MHVRLGDHQSRDISLSSQNDVEDFGIDVGKFPFSPRLLGNFGVSFKYASN